MTPKPSPTKAPTRRDVTVSLATVTNSSPAVGSARSAEDRVLSSRRSPGTIVRLLLRRPVAVISLLWIALVSIASFAAPLLMPRDPYETNLSKAYQGPSLENLLGTDQLGRDLLSRLMIGGVEPLSGAAVALSIAVVVGATAGILAGYLGGVFDWVSSRWVEISMAMPGLIVLLVVLAVFPGNTMAAMVAYGFLIANPVYRVVRAATFAVTPELHVDAAKSAGLGALRILRRHILPRIMGPLIVQATLVAGVSILLNTGLGFLGFGPKPPATSWGALITEASQLIVIHPWMLVPTGFVIILTVLALHSIGDTVRDITNERWAGMPRRARRRQVPAEAAVVDQQPVAGPEGSALLEVRDLTVAFGDDRVRVVEGVSFAVNAGEIVGLVGESGCGKSVTGRALVRLLAEGGEIVGGSIRFDGKDIASMSEREVNALRGSEISYISQDPMMALDPSFTIGTLVGEAVQRQEGLRGSAQKQRVLELLAAVKLRGPEETMRRYPHQISGGMAQRVIIARALAGRPRLLIADEPTTALDVTVQAEILDLLREFQSRFGMAIIFVTHDWGVVADICERAIVMYAGQIVEAAPILDIFAAPKHPYTEGLEASNPHHATRGVPLPALAGSVPAPRDWPTGCRFAARCPYATPDCKEAPIPLLSPGPERLSRCIHIERVGTREGVTK
ncbi:dipeptide/oligopeptide/nickel ABC transporter permease/ATP-binding protein [Salinibacterium sp. GXW1014]|uniref:dipeptide/oligopeptide/nickel ABC transporter permease/ATP-binding protein n=1 Tax=Salinibacterium sp. GXW1014 TaxID=3377838 RepID=UPI00383B2C2E